MRIFLPVLFLLASFTSWAQSATYISGKVYGPGKQPLEGVVVQPLQVDAIAITDTDGDFILNLPSAGRYTLVFTHVSHQTDSLTTLVQGARIVEFTMKVKTIALSEVVVESVSDRENIEQVTPGLTRLGMKEIENLPSFLGELDVIQSITLLPGVNTIGEGASGFNVRGGRIDQNLVLMDGVRLFNTSHVLGFFSIFNPELTKSFSLYKGHIPAHYGGRVSSVLDVQSIQGNKQGLQAKVSVGTFNSKLAFDGPLGKNLTFAIGGRITYSDWMLQQVKDLDIKNSSAGFNDFMARLDYEPSDRTTFKISAYSSFDELTFSTDFGYDWSNQIANFKWQYRINDALISELSASYLDYGSTLFEFDPDQAFRLDNGIEQWQLRQNFNWTPNEHNVNLGLEVVHSDSKVESKAPIDESSQLASSVDVPKDQGREYALYVDDTYKLNDRISISAGLRYTLYQNLGPASVRVYDGIRQNVTDTLFFDKGEVIEQYHRISPRISARWELENNNAFKISYNRLYQYIHLISNTTAATPVDLWQVSNSFFEPVQSDNFSLGYYQNFDNNVWETSVEVFYKNLDHIIEYRDFADLLVNPNIETELLSASGRAYGAELLISKKTEQWKAWLSYTYSRSLLTVEQNEINFESINNGREFPANYDQPHSIRFTSDLKWGKGGSFATTFTYNTGRPISVIESDYLLDELLVPAYTDRNTYRIPDYWRLDMAITMGSIVRKFDDKLVFSVYNVFGRDNAYSVFFRRNFALSIPRPFKLSVLGAVFPSLTYSVTFKP